MVRSLLYGILVMLIIAMVSAFMQDDISFQTATLVFGLICLAIAGILSGAFVSGDRIRANTATEEKEDRRQRQDWSIKIFMFGLPSFLAAILSYYYF